MKEPEIVMKDDTGRVEPHAQRREWVTPSFEQIALKDALAGLGAPNMVDSPNLSS